VVGILKHEDQVLVINQENYDGTRRWSLPGGALEASDADMFRGVEREMLEETGLKVQAVRLRFISEYAGQPLNLLALSMLIECQLVEGEQPDKIHLNNTQPDDNIHGIAWMTRAQLSIPEAGRVLKLPLFWDSLYLSDSDVIHLGRTNA
jgi:ADP-ribose pyrophosphatase YjhB (NUDIX family)